MSAGLYFNDNDPYACAWLQNLYPESHVDARSIADVQPADVAGFRRCHFFGGIGGWEYALQLAGWPAERSVWTGSCPCQPFSAAGRRQGEKDPRHLWPEFRRLIAECAPPVCFGEQVASRLGREWLAGVFADLEGMGYACAGADLCAAGVGAPHIRQRLFWAALAQSERVRACGSGAAGDATSGDPAEGNQRQRLRADAGNGCAALAGGLGDSGRLGSRSRHIPSRTMAATERPQASQHATAYGVDGGLGDSAGERLQDELCPRLAPGEIERTGGAQPARLWDAFALVSCRDGKARRIEPGTFPLADGLPGHLVHTRPDGSLEAPPRSQLLKGFGNSIVPQLAASFIVAFLEAQGMLT